MIYLLISYTIAQDIKTYSYIDLNKKVFQIQATDFKSAAKQCFQKLTGGKYQGEEKGLDIIDICANPKAIK